MGKAIRIGHEETWKDFHRNHPEIFIFFKNGEPIDVDFPSSKIENSSVHIVNGIIESIEYVFEGKFVKYPR